MCPATSEATTFTPRRERAPTLVFVGDDLVIGGFAWHDNTEKLLEGTAWMIDESVGSGRVILFADDPNFV